MHARAPRMLVAGLCIGALTAAALAADQQRAGGPPPAAGTAFLAGQIIEAGSSKPVPSARVTLTSNRGVRVEPVFADSQGRFFFANLPAATYSIQAAVPGYQAAVTASARAIPLADGERYTVARLKLIRLAALSGTVRDEAGDPATGTQVFVLRRGIVNGRAQLIGAGQTRADDRGAYRVSGLRPGEYIICACGREPIPFDGVLLTTIASQPMQLAMLATRAIKLGSDVAGLDNTLRTYPPTYFPNSTTVAQAERVAVAAGEERAGVDISVAAVRAARVSGALSGASGPTTARWIRLMPGREDEDGAIVGAIQPMLVQPDGRFDFVGVPPGQYILKVQHHAVREGGAFGPSGAALAFVGNRSVGPDPSTRLQEGPPPPYWAEEPITVSGADVLGLSVLLRPGPRIAGRIEFAGTGIPPQADVLARSSIAFASLGPESSPLVSLSADGTFAVAGVLPGPYMLSPRMMLPGWSAKAATTGGADVNDLPIDVTRDVVDLVITLTDAPPAMLNGTIAGRPLPLEEDLTALVFPSDRRYWANPAAAARRFRIIGVDRNGAFSAGGLPPGELFVAVIPDEAAADWQDARRLEGFARNAERVTLTEGAKVTLTLRR